MSDTRKEVLAEIIKALRSTDAEARMGTFNKDAKPLPRKEDSNRDAIKKANAEIKAPVRGLQHEDIKPRSEEDEGFVIKGKVPRKDGFEDDISGGSDKLPDNIADSAEDVIRKGLQGDKKEEKSEDDDFSSELKKRLFRKAY